MHARMAEPTQIDWPVEREFCDDVWFCRCPVSVSETYKIRKSKFIGVMCRCAIILFF
jgi:hypothetical protein